MNDGKEEAMIAGLTAEQHDALKTGLRALPDTPAPRVVWERIREQAEAEGLFRPDGKAAPRQWYLGGGLAAAAALVALVVTGVMDSEPVVEDLPTVPALTVEPVPPSRLNVLRAQSSQLEGELAALPGEPRVQRAGTAATIADLTDRIAAIDYQLGDPTMTLSPEEEEIFWRERVRLMKLLVQLRYAQTQRTAF